MHFGGLWDWMTDQLLASVCVCSSRFFRLSREDRMETGDADAVLCR